MMLPKQMIKMQKGDETEATEEADDTETNAETETTEEAK